MSFLDFFFPKFCQNCGWPGTYLCDKCANKIIARQQICPVCEKASKYGLTHPGCQKPHNLNGFWSWTYYDEVVRKMVEQIKYQSYSAILPDLIKHCPFTNFFVIQQKITAIAFIPLHWLRKQQRGFNQAEVLAKELSKKYQLPIIDLLKRTHYTIPQVKIITEEKRKKNIQGVFTIINKVDLPKSVLLVDDVATSLSTLTEAAKVLKKNNIQEVYGFTLCHGRNKNAEMSSNELDSVKV